MDCIKLSINIADETTPVIDWAKSNLLNDKEEAHKHKCAKHTYCTGLSLYEAQCSAGSYSMIYYYYVNLWLNVFFSLLGTLMRGCIDGSSGKRHFSDGLTNSNVNAYLKWEMSSKSSNASRISTYLHLFICLSLSMSVLSNIWNTFVSHLLSIMQLKRAYFLWGIELVSWITLKKTCHSPAACPHFSS